MKKLTKEAKIHLATKVDDMKFTEVGIGGSYFQKGGHTAWINDYNPNDPDSPYCMKYFQRLVQEVNGDLEGALDDVFNLEYGICNLDEVIELILGQTGFKGEVWK